MHYTGEFSIKRTGLPFVSAKLKLSENTNQRGGSVLWSHDHKAYGEAYNDKILEHLKNLINKPSLDLYDLEVEELRYECPYNETLIIEVLREALLIAQSKILYE